MLDLWQNDQARAAAPQPGEATQLPAGFGEAFGAAFEEGQLFSQSLAHENASMEALGEYLTEIKQKTGQDIPLDYGSGEQVPSSALLWMQANDAVTQLKAKNPALDIAPLSDDEMEQRTVAKSRGAVEAAAQVGGREMTTGGRVGFELGGLAAAATDPINIAAVPLAPETSLGILGSALRFGGIAAGAQTAIEAAGAPFHEEVQPGYLESGAPLENIAGAAVGGAVLGGGFKAAGNIWTRLKTGAWPTAIRDAGNVVESEANIQGSNVYPGAAGEAAHRQALSDSIDKILKGEPVDVSRDVSPAMDAQAGKPPLELQTGGPAVDDAVAQAMRRPIVETPMPSGANSTKDLNGPVYVDPRVPEPLRRPVAVHETVEQVMMNQGMPYEHAHVVATQAEKRAVEAAGMDWEKYTHEWDGLLSGIEHEKVQNLPADLHVNPETAIGHHSSASKQGPIEQARTAAEEARTASAPPTEAQPQLPFEATAAVAKMRQTNEVLAGGVQQIARRAGYEMPDAEAATIADKLVKATPAEADDLLRDLQMSPRQAAEAPITGREPAMEGPTSVEPAERVVASPDYEKAIRADLDRELLSSMVPPPKDGTVRFFHGGEDANSGGPRWVTPDVEYARNFRAEGGPNKVWYVDIPKGDATEVAARTFDEIDIQHNTNMVGRYKAIEIPEEWATKLKPYEIADKQIPVGVDADGNVMMRSVDAALNEVDAYKTAADQLAACAAPAPEPQEEAA